MRKTIKWTVLAVIAITLTACSSGNSGSSSGAQETSESNATPLNIVATNFAFDQEEYKVKAGEPIDFSIENAEGLHGYEIKELGIKIEGEGTKQFTIDEPGTYEIACSIMCGPGHDDMISKLIVE